jgi:signal transduction histidine kinase
MSELELKMIQDLKKIVDSILVGQKIDFDPESVETVDDSPCIELKNSIVALANQYNETHRFVVDLSKGKLDTAPPANNSCVTPFKQLQAELLHLTWQIHQISEGDLQQKVSFSGDFSESMNRMISSLREKEKISQLNQQYVEDLKALNATKDKFFSIIAHDLKNPFNGMLGLSEILLESLQHKDTEHLEDIARQLYLSSKQGYKLLLNLLDWSRIQTGKLEVDLRPLNLRKVLEEALSSAQTTALSKNITLEFECPEELMVESDANILQTVIRNLVSNSLKFTHRSGFVKVLVYVDEAVVIEVSDNGVGMTPEQLSNLFRVDASVSTPGTAKERGTGLGLILCKEFLEILHSNITVKSEKGVGSSLSFRLKPL